MPSLLMEKIDGKNLTANVDNNYGWMNYTVDSYATENEPPQQIIVITRITKDLDEVSDLAPEIKFSEAADYSDRVIQDMPNDLVDPDIGPGL